MLNGFLLFRLTHLRAKAAYEELTTTCAFIRGSLSMA